MLFQTKLPYSPVVLFPTSIVTSLDTHPSAASPLLIHNDLALNLPLGLLICGSVAQMSPSLEFFKFLHSNQYVVDTDFIPQIREQGCSSLYRTFQMLERTNPVTFWGDASEVCGGRGFHDSYRVEEVANMSFWSFVYSALPPWDILIPL